MTAEEIFCDLFDKYGENFRSIELKKRDLEEYVMKKYVGLLRKAKASAEKRYKRDRSLLADHILIPPMTKADLENLAEKLR